MKLHFKSLSLAEEDEMFKIILLEFDLLLFS